MKKLLVVQSSTTLPSRTKRNWATPPTQPPGRDGPSRRVECPGLRDPADPHPLAEVGMQVELGLDPVAGADASLHPRSGTFFGRRQVPLPAAVRPDAERPAHGLVHAARRIRQRAGID